MDDHLISFSLSLPLMLFWQYPQATQNYFILCFVACLGVLQWGAARHQKPALSLLGRWGLNSMGIGLGLLLVMGSFCWFFSSTPNLFLPGLAGGELTLLFITGGLSALLVARLAGVFWQKVAPALLRQEIASE